MTGPAHSALIPAAQARPGDDPIFALNAEARSRAASGESIVNATLGVLTEDDGTLATMPVVAEVMADLPVAAAAGYAPIAGSPGFLQAVHTDLFGQGPLADESVSVATPGGTGAIYQALVNFLERGQNALTTHHYWGPYGVIAEHAGRGIERFPTFCDGGGFNAHALAAAIDAHMSTQGRALLLLNFPCHNPTGYSLSDQEWRDVTEAVAEAAARGPIAVLLDAAYVHFAHSDRWREALAELREHATVLVAWTASKAFTQYGARVGALVAVHPDAAERTRLGEALGYTCRATWSNCNHLGQLTVARIVSDGALRGRADGERSRLLDLLDERVRAFDEAAGGRLEVPRHEGGFFLSVFTPDAERTAAVMREHGVYVVPLDGAVRVAACSTAAAEMSRVVEALEAGVAAAHR